MTTYTDNLNLTKPDGQEQYNIETFNDNFDKIDAVVDLVPKLYTNIGSNIDGSITQAKLTELLNNKITKSGDETTGTLKIFDSLSENAGQLIIKNGDNTYGIIHRADGNNYYILLTNQNDANGSYNSLRPFTLNLSNGSVAFSNGITMPTRPNNDNSTDGANTAFVKNAALGNYVNVNSSIISSNTSLRGNSNLPYTLNLPNDGKKYLVLIWGEMRTENSTNDDVNLKIGSDICSAFSLCKVNTRTNATHNTSGSCWIPVSSSHKIYVQRSSDWQGTMTALVFGGYMRMGENT